MEKIISHNTQRGGQIFQSSVLTREKDNVALYETPVLAYRLPPVNISKKCLIIAALPNDESIRQQPSWSKLQHSLSAYHAPVEG